MTSGHPGPEDHKTRRTTVLADSLSRLLQLDVRFYTRSFAWLSLGHVSGVIRGIATTFLMARWLDTTVLGQFRYVLALFGVAGVFAMSGMSSAVIRGVAKGDTVMARIALKRILLVAPLGSLALLIAAAERLWWAHEPTVAAALAIGAVAFTPYSASGLYGSILTGQEKIKELSRIALANNLLFSAAFIAVFFWQKDLVTLTLAYFGFDILLRGFLTVRELRKLPVSGSAADHLKLGNNLSGINILQVIAAQLDHILIQRFAGYHTLAVYSVATVIPEQIKDLVNSMSGTLLQRMSRHKNTPEHARVTRRHYWIALGGSAAVVAAYAVAAPFVLPWLFPQYDGAVLLSVVYALGLLAMPATVGVFFFQAHADLPRLWRFFMTNAILQIIANLALIPFFGNWGAAWSRILTRFVGLPLSYPVASRTKDDTSASTSSAV